MELGVIINLMEHPEEEFRKVNEFGFRTCQVNGWNQDLFTEEIANRVIASCQKYRVQITSFWCGWEGPAQWNFTEGPLTLGLVPPAFRHERLKMLMKGVDFAVSIGAPSLTTHVGFIPENQTILSIKIFWLPCGISYAIAAGKTYGFFLKRDRRLRLRCCALLKVSGLIISVSTWIPPT